MRPELILKSFEATGVWPMDSEVILKRFNATTLDKDKDTELRKLGNGDTWRDIRKILDAAVAERAKDEGKRVAAVLHSLQVQNELLYHENEGLCAALITKKRQDKKSKVLDL
jgi:broad specificity phosphatase PhoE